MRLSVVAGDIADRKMHQIDICFLHDILVARRVLQKVAGECGLHVLSRLDNGHADLTPLIRARSHLKDKQGEAAGHS